MHGNAEFTDNTKVAFPARLVLGLSITQVIGWATTFNAPAILGRSMAADIGLSVPAAFAASTAFLVVVALCSPLLASAFPRFGAQRVLTLGSLLTGIALALASQAASPVAYFFAWGALGIGGAMVLSTAAHALLSETLGTGAKRWIAAVMLASGLSASIGFPITELLHQGFGWRNTLLVFAGLHVFVCLPLHMLVVPYAVRSAQKEKRAREAADENPIPPFTGKQRAVFIYLCATVSLIGFVTWGLSVAIVELLKSVGLAPTAAVFVASMIGVIQVGARSLEFFFAANASALLSAMIATAVMPLAFVILFIGQGHDLAAYAFVLIYGLASGVMSVARATLPLELFDILSYGYRMAQLALPMNLAFAVSVPMFVAVIEYGGVRYAALLGFCCSAAAFAAICLLRRANASSSPPNL